MDATTIERLKHAQEVLGWIIEGKSAQTYSPGLREWTDLAPWGKYYHCVVEEVMKGTQYRLKPAKTIRPFTEQEARRLVGCVAVDGGGYRFLCVSVWPLSTLCTAAEKRWHYHLPGDPDNLKPCWVEE